jgi:cell wall-associated NlpC family hydrolase
MTPRADTFVRLALSQAGDRYVYGAKEPASDPDPKAHGGAFDCSGLITWAAHRAGVTGFPDGSWAQLEYCKHHATVISVAQAEHIRGALLFLGPGGSEHVVISLGNGETIEARGAAYGVGSWSVYRDAWVAGALVPGLDYNTHPDDNPRPPRPEAFVKRLQIIVGMHGRDVDGLLGPRTVAAVNRFAHHRDDPVVRRLQRLFRTLPGERVLPVDGDWGPQTSHAWDAARHDYPLRRTS